jgi:hypothetical protein
MSHTWIPVPVALRMDLPQGVVECCARCGAYRGNDTEVLPCESRCPNVAGIRQQMTHLATLKALQEHRVVSLVRRVCALHADRIDTDWLVAGRITGRLPQCEWVEDEV